ncbi:hypothetical protein O181_068114 [Austropuccinia psidii MF-1]|uniref:Phosphatidic acid phosphatase type 2/haloperoxidase domain-containing protein n=1 Tax=Austropuccinia psidii MF-1 TaxID=1389203 RepID=A0A9Q3I787_9BASI|nr:hypothetical protein [Austropuccinia psidii MF-1]
MFKKSRSKLKFFDSDFKQSSSLNVFLSFLLDWLMIIFLVIGFSFINRIQGFHREFDLNDPTIQFTHVNHERVPVHLLIILAIVIPVILIVFTSQFLLKSKADTHLALLGLALSLTMALVITVSVKVTVGRPRPDMLARCQPSPQAISNMTSRLGKSNSSICTAPVNSKEFQDGFRSFPSGHSSTAWSGLGYLAIYLAGKLNLLRNRIHSIKLWIPVTPLLGATLIAVSRTMDYRHHWQDVLVGSLIGLITAWFSYRLYYPSLAFSHPHQPYPQSSSPSTIDKSNINDHQSSASHQSLQQMPNSAMSELPQINPTGVVNSGLTEESFKNV